MVFQLLSATELSRHAACCLTLAPVHVLDLLGVPGKLPLFHMPFQLSH